MAAESSPYNYLNAELDQAGQLRQRLQDPQEFQNIVMKAAMLYDPPPQIAEAVGMSPQQAPMGPPNAPPPGTPPGQENFAQMARQVPNPDGLNIGGPELAPQPGAAPPQSAGVTAPDPQAQARAAAYAKMAQMYMMAQQAQLQRMRPAPAGSYGSAQMMPRVQEARLPRPQPTPSPTLGQLLNQRR